MRIVAQLCLAVLLTTLPVVDAAAQPAFFSTGIGTAEDLNRTGALGVEQDVFLAAPTTLGSFGFWLGTTGTVDMKFLIFRTLDDVKVFEQVRTLTNVARGTLVQADASSVLLAANTSYTFAIIGDGQYSVSQFFPIVQDDAVVNQGIFQLGSSNSNWTPYAAPTRVGGTGGSTIALQIEGARPRAVPEPSSLAMLTLGLLGLGAAKARRSSLGHVSARPPRVPTT